MSKNTMWLAVVVALLVGVFVGFVFERQRATDKMEAAKLSWQKQIEDSKMSNDKLMMENTQLIRSLTPSPTAEPTGAMKKVTPTPSSVMKK